MNALNLVASNTAMSLLPCLMLLGVAGLGWVVLPGLIAVSDGVWSLLECFLSHTSNWVNFAHMRRLWSRAPAHSLPMWLRLPPFTAVVPSTTIQEDRHQEKVCNLFFFSPNPEVLLSVSHILLSKVATRVCPGSRGRTQTSSLGVAVTRFRDSTRRGNSVQCSFKKIQPTAGGSASFRSPERC